MCKISVSFFVFAALFIGLPIRGMEQKEQIKTAVKYWLKNVEKRNQCRICSKPLGSPYYIARPPKEEKLIKNSMVHWKCFWQWFEEIRTGPRKYTHDFELITGACTLCHRTSDIKNVALSHDNTNFFKDLNGMLSQYSHTFKEAIFYLETLGYVSTGTNKEIDAKNEKKLQKLLIFVKKTINHPSNKRCRNEGRWYMAKITKNVLGIISKDSITTDFLLGIWDYPNIGDYLNKEKPQLFATIWNTKVWTQDPDFNQLTKWWKELTKEERVALFNNTLPLINDDKKKSFNDIFGVE